MTVTDRRSGVVGTATLTERRDGVTSQLAVKRPCRVAATSNITLSGLQTIDGVTLVADERVLVTGQANAVDNGVWVASSGNWTRATDFDGALDAVEGTFIFVAAGTVNEETLWAVTTDNEFTIGTSSLTIERIRYLDGPASATDNAIARFDGTNGRTLQSSVATIGDDGAVTVTTSSANALTIGRLGATTPALHVDASTASSVTGVKITAAAVAGGVTLAAISSGASENLNLTGKSFGTVNLTRPILLYSDTVSDAAGGTWISRSDAVATGTFIDVAWSAELGLFVANGLAGALATSPDGLTYTARSAAAANDWHGVIYCADFGRFVSVSGGSLTTSVQTSSNGITWTARSTPNTNNWDGICYIPSAQRLVVVGYSGTGNRVMTSDDGGVTWTARTSAADNDWADVAYSPELGRLAAVANSGTGNRVMTSDDNGVTWTSRTVATDRNWDGIIWAPEFGRFVAVAYSGTTDSAMTSPDGITWTLRTTPNTNQWTRIAYSPQLRRCAATGITGGTDRVMTSDDGGITWTAHTTTSDRWGGIDWSPELGVFGAASWDSTKMISTPPADKNRFATLYGGLLGVGTHGSLANRQITIGGGNLPFGGIGFAAGVTGTELWALGFETAFSNRMVLYNAGTASYPLTVSASSNLITMLDASITNTLTAPLLAGGTGASSTLTLESTSGSGTSDAIIFKTASQVHRGHINSAGLWNIGANLAPNTGVLLTVNKNAAALPAPTFSGTVVQFGQVDGTATRFYMDAFAINSTLNFRRANGTAASPTALTSGNRIGAFFFEGATGTGTYNSTDAAGLHAYAASNFTGSSAETDIAFNTIPSGSHTSAEVIRFLGAGNVKFTNAANFAANNGQTVTITNVGPAAITATIAKWLKFVDSGGTTSYIPVWQ